MEPAEESGVATPYWRSDLTSGWLYLLPPLSTKRVLCLSAHPNRAASQANLFLQLTLLHDTGLANVPRPEAVRDESPVLWHGVDEIAVAAAGGAPLYDGLILHDPEGEILHRASLPHFERMLQTLRPALRRGAFVYVGMRHAWSLQQLAGRLAGRGATVSRHRPCSVGRVRRSLLDAGLVSLRMHPYLMWGAKMAEVISARGYRSTKNRSVLRERIKERVFGRWGAQIFAPAYGVIGFIEMAEDSTIEQLTKRVGSVPGTALPVLKQYLVFPGDKAIVSLGPAEHERKDTVAILAGDALAIERRRAETRTLASLAALPPSLASLVPRVVDSCQIGNTSVFLVNRFPGVSLDLDIRGLNQVTDNALRFITELHRHTARPVRIDEAGCQARFGRLLDAAAQRNPWLAADLHAWKAPLQSIVVDATLPIVWFHGDFKVENVLYDPKSFELTGVIDWELAMLPGLPLLDPLYLLIYNRVIRGAYWIDALVDVLVRSNCTPGERLRLDRYAGDIGLTPEQQLALAAAFIAHHIGYRMHLLDPGAHAGPLRALVHEMTDVLERTAALARRCTV